MPVISPAKLNIISKASGADPKKAIWDALDGAIDKINPFGSWVLVGTYIAPEKIGSIFIPDKSKDEDLYQGIVGLVLKKGPQAFQDDAQNVFRGEAVEVNQWVLFRFSSAWEFHLNGVSVRFVPDIEIKGTIEHPELVSGRPVAALGGGDVSFSDSMSYK